MKKRVGSGLEGNGPPPDQAAALYVGTVMHQRMKPVSRRFAYRVFSVLLDLDRLADASRASAFFSINRFNMLSLHEKDHGPRDGSNLRQHIDTLLEREGIPSPARILLLAYPRVLGYAFNPLSVYYAFDAERKPTAIVYEVRNTFGGLHTYVEPVRPDQISEGGIRQDRRKEFYVSPFLPMELHYFFRMLPPGEDVRVRILEKDTEGPVLSATFSGTRKPFTTASLLRASAAVPLLGFKIFGAIHLEAFNIWRKRVPFHARPGTRVSHGEEGQFLRRVPTVLK